VYILCLVISFVDACKIFMISVVLKFLKCYTLSTLDVMEKRLDLRLLDKLTAFFSGDLITPILHAGNSTLKKFGFAL